MAGDAGSTFGRGANLGRTVGLATTGGNAIGKNLRIAENHRQQIVEVVGHASGQASDGFHFLRVAEPIFQRDALRNVSNSRGHKKFLLSFERAEADFDWEFGSIFAQCE